MIELLGFLGGLCFALSAVPLAVSAVRAGNIDIPWSTILLVCSGAFFMFVYGAYIQALPLVADMIVTGTACTTIALVKLKDSK